MPDLDGWSVLKALKDDPELRAIPVVLVTIMADRDMGFALGAADFVTKPFDRELLIQAVNRHRRGDGSAQVLVVDDDPKIAGHVAAHAAEGGLDRGRGRQWARSARPARALPAGAGPARSDDAGDGWLRGARADAARSTPGAPSR